MNSKNFYSEYNNNGVINIKNCFKLKLFKKIKKKYFNMSLGSLLMHNGYTYHYSGTNKSRKSRLALSIRFIAGDHKYMPHPFEGGAFSKQFQFKKGQIFSGKSLPIIY